MTKLKEYVVPATKKLRLGTKHPLPCVCGSGIELRTKGGKLSYYCHRCRMDVASAHQEDGYPSSIPGTAEEKSLRVEIHQQMDDLLNRRVFKRRRSAYNFLTNRRPNYIHPLSRDGLVHLGYLSGPELIDVKDLLEKKGARI